MELTYLWIIALCVTTSLSVDYNDLKRMGVACSPRDTCKRSRRGFHDTNCECERSCLIYNDCCVDGPVPTRRHKPQKLEGLTCVPFLPDQGVYGISTCSSSWDGPPSVKDKCENEDDLSDPIMSIPATDTQTRLTYSSVNCAVCNSANPTVLSIWNLQVTCNSLSDVQSDFSNITREFILENIVRVGKQWGVYHWNTSQEGITFFPCDLMFAVPRDVANSVRYCRPYVVSTCAPDWNRESERKDCLSYMAVVYIEGQAYRNAHCALCNHVSVDNVKCLPGGSDIKKTWLSFTLVLDVDRNDNENAQDRCSSGKVYDPIFKKCRRLICRLPGYVVKNGECVKN